MENTIKAGTHFIINGRNVGGKNILVGRTMEFTQLSKKPGFANGYLTNPKTGKLQKTEISIPLELLEEIPAPQLEEVV